MSTPGIFEPTWALIKRPSGYSDQKMPGKIEQIYSTNSHTLYHKLPNDINSYVYPDESGKGLSGLRKYESRTFPIGSAPIDVIRVTKFIGTGTGLLFLGKQFLLQSRNPYNETRLYNPASPIVAAGMSLALGAIRPSRFIDISSIAGFARSMIGNAIPDAIFGPPKVIKPPGTAPAALTGGPLETTGGKGLLRAQDANRGKANLQSAWGTGGSQNKTFGSIVKDALKSLINQNIPSNQDANIQFRSDEGTYGLMINAGSRRFKYIVNGKEYGFGQQWIAGTSGVKGIRKDKEYPTQPYRLFIKYDNGMRQDYPYSSLGEIRTKIPNVGDVGYVIKESGDPNKPGYRYGDSIGSTVTNDEYRNSDIMVQYKFYSDPAQDFPTKVTDKQRTDEINKTLIKSLEKIKSGGTYNVNINPDSTIIYSGNSNYKGYDRILNTKTDKSQTPMMYPLGVLSEYRGITVIDNAACKEDLVYNSKKFPTAGHFDAINTLTVLDKDKKINNSKLKGWDTWVPTLDDQIAFCFYDVVNEKYIPFRATIKGLSENGNVSWEELSFIGRGDKIYSYGGFNRNLSLNFTVVIGSIVELAPTWQRINYLTTLIKPSNYTKANMTVNGDTVYNRFMVPPMVMLTIGDMYKDQPILIQAITTTIPDDASWETLTEDNIGPNWEYLSSYIKAPGVLFGQLPRTVDIQMTLILLEKERAIVGGANFGHAPRDENLDGWNISTVPNGGDPQDWHKNLVVKQKVLDTTKATPDILGPPMSAAPPASNAFPLLTTSVNNPFTVPYNIGNTNNAAPPLSAKPTSRGVSGGW